MTAVTDIVDDILEVKMPDFTANKRINDTQGLRVTASYLSSGYPVVVIGLMHYVGEIAVIDNLSFKVSSENENASELAVELSRHKEHFIQLFLDNSQSLWHMGVTGKKSNVLLLKRIDIKALGAIRQRLGADNENDTSYDDKIEKLTNSELMEKYIGWHLGDSWWWQNPKSIFDRLEAFNPTTHI